MTVPKDRAAIRDSDKLDALLLSAHARNDGEALAALYNLAADRSEAAGNIDAACFFLTHAYVFALQWGLDTVGELQMRLWRYGREVKPEGMNPNAYTSTGDPQMQDARHFTR
jgi:hypothetical protein